MHKPDLRTRYLTIVAQDPAIRDSKGKILTARVSLPAEELALRTAPVQRTTATD